MDPELEEAATVRAQAQGLLKGADTMLSVKRLPASLRDALTTLRTQLRRPWAELEADEDKGGDDEEETKESELVTSSDELAPLVEATIRRDGTIPIKIITPGKGSSGHYSPDVLKRDGPKVFLRGTKMYWDHPTAQESRERPERSLRDLAAEFTTDARWEDNGAAGPGLYADAKVFAPYQEAVKELAPHIGVSIRAAGRIGKSGMVESIVRADSVDFVTMPGAGGQIVSLFEAARNSNYSEEPRQVDEAEAKELRESVRKQGEDLAKLNESITALTTENANLKTENARFREGAVLVEAKSFIEAEVAKATTLPEITRKRLSESLAANPITKDGAFDKEGQTAKIVEAIKAETDYLKNLGVGRVRDMGGSSGGDKPTADAALEEAFRAIGLSEAGAKTAAAGR